MVKQSVNVANLNQNRIYNYIVTFLNNKAKKSKNTAIKFEKDIRDFFKYLRNKDIEDLEREDLDIKNKEVLEYQNYLTERYKNSVVNGKLTAVRSLYKFLKRDDNSINIDALIVDDLPDDSKKIGFLTPDEAMHLARLALTEREKGKMKQALILLAAATSLRKNALLELKYSDIRPSEDNPDKYIIYTTDHLDKGKPIEKEIHKKLYELLLEIKDENSNDDKIFHITNKSIDQMMKRLCKKAGIDPRRNITFHSLKKAGAEFAYEYTKGDMFAVTAQGGWTNPTTPYKHYMKKQRNIAGMAMFEDINDNIFDQLTREEAIKLLKSIGNGLGARLKKEAKEIIENRYRE